MKCEHGGRVYKADERFIDRDHCQECYCLNYGQVTCRDMPGACQGTRTSNSSSTGKHQTGTSKSFKPLALNGMN